MTLPTRFLGTFFLGVGSGLSSANYVHLQSRALEKDPDEGRHQFLTLNACMFMGGLPWAFGGLNPAQERIPSLSRLIMTHEPDIVFFQELSFGASLSLYRHLRESYPHCYTHMIPSTFGIESCLGIYSKYPGIVHVLRLPSLQTGIQKAACFFETTAFIAVTTHLDPHNTLEAIGMRRTQMALIMEEVAKLYQNNLKNREFGKEAPQNFDTERATIAEGQGASEHQNSEAKPTEPKPDSSGCFGINSGKRKPLFFLGDLNISRTGAEGDEYSTSLIATHFFDLYKERNPTLTPDTATCTDALTEFARGKKPPRECYSIVDYALIDKASKNLYDVDVELVRTFAPKNPKTSTSLSDHHALFFTAKRKGPVL